jgi:HD-like signal output (HDOD) protein
MNQPYVPAFTLTPTAKAPVRVVPPTVSTPRFIDDVTAGRVELPTIPRVVQRIVAALQDPDIDARKIGEALSQDPVLSAKVLRIANSSYFGGERSMASIDAAIALIGTQALSRLIMACGVSSSFKEVPGIDLRIFWRDALVAATAANKLAATLSANTEEAYICGLLHATGHLILCQTYPDIASAMFAGFDVVRGAELSAIELEAFGIDHPEVGALWVRSLGFPLTVADTIGRCARPPAAVDGTLDLALRGACGLAAAVASKESVAVALTRLPSLVRERFTAPDGTPARAFAELCECLQKTEPML